ncbi:hypothetical protein FACS1894111_11750 [Clostridia bacterium]|nr:hypothetical protein FACS1894111_11750 [Clostridia bacterium]
MAINLQTNMAAMLGIRNTKISGAENAKSSEKLSSGYRINRAADDAAGLSISEKMRAQVRGLNQADRNIQDGISLIGVADGALQEAHSIIQRMRELAVQAANDTNTPEDRAALNAEYKQLAEEVEMIADRTTFNGMKILSGEYAREILASVSMTVGGALADTSFDNNTARVKWLQNTPPPTGLGAVLTPSTPPAYVPVPKPSAPYIPPAPTGLDADKVATTTKNLEIPDTSSTITDTWGSGDLNQIGTGIKDLYPDNGLPTAGSAILGRTDFEEAYRFTSGDVEVGNNEYSGLLRYEGGTAYDDFEVGFNSGFVYSNTEGNTEIGINQRTGNIQIERAGRADITENQGGAIRAGENVEELHIGTNTNYKAPGAGGTDGSYYVYQLQVASSPYSSPPSPLSYAPVPGSTVTTYIWEDHIDMKALDGEKVPSADVPLDELDVRTRYFVPPHVNSPIQVSADPLVYDHYRYVLIEPRPYLNHNEPPNKPGDPAEPDGPPNYKHFVDSTDAAKYAYNVRYDEYEPAYVYSEAKTNTIDRNAGGIVFIETDKDKPGTETIIGKNENFNVENKTDTGVIDTNTEKVYVTQFNDGNIFARNKSDNSIFELGSAATLGQNNRSGNIWTDAKKVTIYGGGISNAGNIYSENNAGGSSFTFASETKPGTNNGNIEVAAEKVTIYGTNNSSGGIDATNKDVGSTFDFGSVATPGMNSGKIRTGAEKVKIYGTNNNSGLITATNNDAGSTFDFGSVATPGTNSGTIWTDAKKVEIYGSNSGRIIANNNYSGSTFDFGSVATPGTNSGTITVTAETVNFNGTNKGTIDAQSEKVTVNGTNTSTIEVASTDPTDVTTFTRLDTNGYSAYPATLRTNTYTVEVNTNGSLGTITTTNGELGSAFTITTNGDPAYSGSGSIYGINTAAETVSVTNNYGNLKTTNGNPNSTLTVTENGPNGKIETQARAVTISTNNGSLDLTNKDTTATIETTGATSKIESNAAKLTITDELKGEVTVMGAGKELVLKNGVGEGATVNLPKDTTFTIGGENKGTILFNGAVSMVDSLDNGGTVELNNTKTVNINQNSGTGVIKLLNDSSAKILENTTDAVVEISGRVIGGGSPSTAEITTNDGTVRNGGDLTVTNNTGIIENYGTVNSPIPNNTGTVRQHASDFDTSQISFPALTDGYLTPALQECTLSFTANGKTYTMTAVWKEDFDRDNIECHCTTVGVHEKDDCADMKDMEVLHDAFSLEFLPETINPTLPAGEEIVFDEHEALSIDDRGLNYELQPGALTPDIYGRATGTAGYSLTYKVNAQLELEEHWEEGQGLWLQVGAYEGQGLQLHIPRAPHDADPKNTECVFCDCGELKSGSLLTYQSASGTIDICDLAIDNVSEIRSMLGAQENRLTHIDNSVNVASENTSRSESRIRDTDMAKEMVLFSKSKILQESGMAMIAQANQNVNSVLQLLSP